MQVRENYSYRRLLRGAPWLLCLPALFLSGCLVVATPPLKSSGDVSVSFSTESQTRSEGAGSALVAVELSEASSSEVSVAYTVSGTASYPSDHGLAEGVLTIAPGQTSAQITVPIVENASEGADKTVVITLAGASGASLGASAVHALTILDNELKITPTYPVKGAAWNDYVQRAVVSKDRFSQVDQSCPESGIVIHSQCVHAGEMRRVRVADHASCSNLTMTDALGAFDWTCKVEGGLATFHSSLKSAAGLGDLIDFTLAVFKDNSVTLRVSGTPVATSSAGIWWGNPVLPLPNNAGAGDALVELTGEGTIYALGASRDSKGYKLGAKKLGLVLAPAATLMARADMAAACVGGKCLVDAASAARFGWVEGSFTGFSGMLYNVKVAASSRVHRSTIVGGSGTGLTDATGALVLAGGGSTVSLTEVRGSLANGIYGPFAAGGGHLLKNVSSHSNGNTNFENGFSGEAMGDISIIDSAFANNSGSGVFIWGGTRNALINVRSYNNFLYGIQFDTGSSANAVVGAILANNYAGIGETYGASAYVNTLIANNSDFSFNASAFGAQYGKNRYVNSASLNNLSGLKIYSGAGVPAEEHLARNFLAAYNDTGITLEGATSGNRFTGKLWVGANGTSCSVSSTGDNPGLVNGSCANQGASDATLVTGVAPATSLAGKAYSDSANTNDTGGAAAVGSITQWTRFESSFRTWGKDGSAFANADHRGRCTAGNCRIWDWRILYNDTLMLKANGEFLAGQPCPASAHGNQTVALPAGSPLGTAFLANAVEITGDDRGDDDGLCESSEACVYSPNIGAYQGAGDYSSSTCSFQDGTVTGVTLHGYPSNGYSPPS